MSWCVFGTVGGILTRDMRSDWIAVSTAARRSFRFSPRSHGRCTACVCVCVRVCHRPIGWQNVGTASPPAIATFATTNNRCVSARPPAGMLRMQTGGNSVGGWKNMVVVLMWRHKGVFLSADCGKFSARAREARL